MKNGLGQRAARTLLMAGSSLAILMSAAPAFAQSGGAREILIEAQSLEAALAQLASRFDVDIVAPGGIADGLSAPQVQGNLTARQALRRLLAGSGLTFQSAPNGAFVIQRSASDADNQIVVTGTKQNRTIKETVESVTVITEEDIEEQVLFDVQDILLRTANVSTGGRTLNQLSIRGVTLTGVGGSVSSGAGTGLTSQIYFDNAPISVAANEAIFNLWDIEQFEVLRGPQSTAQGRNALAGALVIQTADPEYEFGAAGRALYGNKDQLQGSAMITGPIIADQLAFRLTADYREVDFDVISRTPGSIFDNQSTAFEEVITLRGKILFEPEFAPSLRLELSSNYAETQYGDFGPRFAPSRSSPDFATFDPFEENFITVGRARGFDYDVLVNTANLQFDLSPAWTIIANGSFEDSDRNDVREPGSFNRIDEETYSAELRAAFDYGSILGWIGGYYFDRARFTNTDLQTPLAAFGLATDPEGSVVRLQSQIDESTENFAFFGDLTFEVSETLRINVGARYDFEEFSIQTIQNNFADPETCVFASSVPGLAGLPCGLLFATTAEPRQETDFEAFLPRASIAYDISKNVTAGLLIARGYRAGGSYIFADADTTMPEVRTFDPEFVTNYELSLRSFFPQLGLTLNANAFYTDWTDQQVTVFGPSGLASDFDVLNAGESEIYGVEIEANAEVTSEFSIFATLGLLQTSFRDFAFATTGEFENLAGNEFNNAPNITAGFGFSYNASSGFFASANGNIVGNQFSDVTNLPANETNGYALFNARAGYRFGGVEIALFANNVFDERAFVRILNDQVNTGTGLIAPIGTPSVNVVDPRLYGIELRLGF
ncbi:MAG: TonB-dependent receptor [Pseudomonadota bacterium]